MDNYDALAFVKDRFTIAFSCCPMEHCSVMFNFTIERDPLRLDCLVLHVTRELLRFKGNSFLQNMDTKVCILLNGFPLLELLFLD